MNWEGGFDLSFSAVIYFLFVPKAITVKCKAGPISSNKTTYKENFTSNQNKFSTKITSKSNKYLFGCSLINKFLKINNLEDEKLYFPA